MPNLISVFIVSYNTSDLLEKCLSSVFTCQNQYALEVFVADNNSSDGTQQMVDSRFPQATLVPLPQNVGFTKAINRILPLGRGDYYLLLHPDLIIFPETLGHFLTFFEEHKQAGILGGNLEYPDGTPNPCEILFPSFKNDLTCFTMRLVRKTPAGKTYLGRHCYPLEWCHETTTRVNWVWNACMMVRKEVVLQIGYFDEDFFVWYADWDFCKRASDMGWQVYYLSSAKAVHHESQSFRGDNLPTEAVRYKIDGWQSASMMIPDRYTFIKKHCPDSLAGIKAVDVLQNTLRLGLILYRSLKEKPGSSGASLSLKAYKDTMHAILR